MLDIYSYYIGVYILIVAGAVVMICAFLGCCSALMEQSLALFVVGILRAVQIEIQIILSHFQFIITQILCFLLTIIGAAVLLEHATHNSRIQPIIRYAMTRFIMTSEYPASANALKMIQENVSSLWILFQQLSYIFIILRSVAVALKARTTIWCWDNHYHLNVAIQWLAMPTSMDVWTNWPGI